MTSDVDFELREGFKKSYRQTIANSPFANLPIEAYDRAADMLRDHDIDLDGPTWADLI
jgi:hypothetical protein